VLHDLYRRKQVIARLNNTIRFLLLRSTEPFHSRCLQHSSRTPQTGWLGHWYQETQPEASKTGGRSSADDRHKCIDEEKLSTFSTTETVFCIKCSSSRCSFQHWCFFLRVLSMASSSFWPRLLQPTVYACPPPASSNTEVSLACRNSLVPSKSHESKKELLAETARKLPSSNFFVLR